VPHASITIKETQQGGSADADGNYSVSVDRRARTLVFSFVGKASQEISIGNKTNIDVTLKQEDAVMNEVVVVGYGTQKRSEIAASISSVKSKDIENRPYTSVDQELQGKVAGLQAPTLTGQPGAAQSIRIRGIGSATAGADPLYVVDGININSGDLTGLTTTANALAGLNPNDIESVAVLKDAQATSIYGSRGANGVILITTKKGRSGKTKFNVNVEVGVNKRADEPPNARLLNATEYVTLLKEGVINAGGTQADVDYYTNLFGGNSGVNTNWLDIITRTGMQQDYNLSASGGDAKNQFYVSGGYFTQQATVIASDFKRYSFRTNYKHIASDKLNFIVNLTGSNAIQNSPNNGGAFSNPVGSLPFLRPTVNPYNADGSLNIGSDFSGGQYNPLYIAKYDKYNTNTALIQGSVGAEYSILKGLKFSSRFGIDYNVISEYNFWNQFHGDGTGYGGLLQTTDSRFFNWINTNQFDYTTAFGASKNIRLDAKLGYEAQKSKSYSVYSAGQGFPPTNQLFYSVNSATPVGASSSGSDYDFAGIYSAATVSYQNKYIVSGSFRRDGSSRFSQNNLYGNFWSAGAAWNIDKENFLSNISFVSALKLRASYGTSGNAAINNYQWRPTVHYAAPYGGHPGGTFDVVGNENLTWESTKQGDIGLDAGFLKDRISLVFDIYRRISDRLLFNNPLSATTGFTSVIDNIGKIENKGMELTLSGTPVKTKDFTWDLTFNISHNTNKIVKLPGHKDIASGAFLLREGYAFNTFYVREWAGVDPANGNPLWYVDGTHSQTTSNYNSAQRQLLGTASPKYFGGLTSTLNYKGIDLQTDFVFNYGNVVRDGWIFYSIDGAYPDLNRYALNLQRWQKPGDITNVPKYVFGSTTNSNSFSTRFLYKGDFIRLRNLTLGYSLSNTILSKLKISTLRLYIRGTNLWTKTYDKNLTIDPEQGINSASNLNVFYTRSMTLGLNLTF
ncbi:MAG TPA: TonB-dependent receptor, partial [Chitinophagaceae bacterium]|nr:TonB-dependent receptor [Chitinophagaceae bacterium]